MQGRSTTKLTRVMAPFGAMVSSYGWLQQIGIYHNDYAQISLTNYKTVLYKALRKIFSNVFGGEASDWWASSPFGKVPE